MAEVVDFGTPADEAVELRRGITAIISEIEHLHDLSRQHQAEIECSRTRTRQMLDELRAQLRTA